jgi:hypothetical protein
MIIFLHYIYSSYLLTIVTIQNFVIFYYGNFSNYLVLIQFLLCYQIRCWNLSRIFIGYLSIILASVYFFLLHFHYKHIIKLTEFIELIWINNLISIKNEFAFLKTLSLFGHSFFMLKKFDMTKYMMCDTYLVFLIKERKRISNKQRKELRSQDLRGRLELWP